MTDKTSFAEESRPASARPPKIVLTGGPSGGKTTVALTIEREMGDQIHVIPEAASLIFNGGFPRRVATESRRFQQRAIYYVQREMEALASEEHPAKVLICDRGSMDGTAYWPTGAQGFLSELSTSAEAEYARYDWIIHLDTASEKHYNTTSVVRIESYAQAIQLNELVHRAWHRHPQRFVITNTHHFVEKLDLAMEIVRRIVAGESYSKIKASLGKT